MLLIFPFSVSSYLDLNPAKKELEEMESNPAKKFIRYFPALFSIKKLIEENRWEMILQNLPIKTNNN